MARVFIAIGSNLGDRVATIKAAFKALAELPETEILAVGGTYEFPPQGGPEGQGPYLNSACLVSTDFEPHPFLSALHDIERSLGRRRESEIRWGSRTIDLDILLWDDLTLNVPGLTIPHPRIAEREFVLRPLADIAPEQTHPGLGLTIRELLRRLTERTKKSAARSSRRRKKDTV